MLIENCNWSDDKVQKEIIELINERKLIPVIGSGFTWGCATNSGSVPDGNTMLKHLIEFLSKASGNSKEFYNKYDFSEICTLFEETVPKKDQHEYFIKNFTGVKLPENKIHFLDINWRYIYTLNIDDGIETNCPKYKIILPRRDYNEDYFSNFETVFKIHGDVHFYLHSNEELILNSRQYTESLMNNKDMLARFKTDFAENNLLYIGCSLIKERDLLSVIRSAIANGHKQRKTYYVSSEPLSSEDKILLKDFGVTTCVIVNDYNTFYNDVIRLSSVPSIKSEDAFIDFYCDPTISIIPKRLSNMEYLLNSNNLVRVPYDKTIYKPHFFISRDAIKSILNKLKRNPIHIVYGRRISGKTFCLIDICESIKDKNLFFFPSNIEIDFEILKKLVSEDRRALIFDTGCLEQQHLIWIINNKTRWEKQGIIFVIAINSSERKSIDLYDSNDLYETTEIENHFSERELKSFNSLLSNCNIPKFLQWTSVKKYGRKIHLSILDNLCKLSSDFSNDYTQFNMSGINSAKKMVPLLLLATNKEINFNSMNYFNIHKECQNLVDNFPTVFEYSFNENISGISRRDTRGKIIVNARYYLLKVLNEYANDKENHNNILDAYKYIYEKIEESETDEYFISRKMLDFIKFDVINDIFYSRGGSLI
ncbi:hypothetical protein MsAg5_09220 [Methanosarcinaceae archaeon Ag5]|uniref:SIR2-like domain-containing protein n=1 Tax=Methanolapillus africanus TaxID=3028297 RepID=A0AAE4MJM6_9EURY|nr:hypothetical protein [Methanosarcinaceae archaeon Ag5]